MPLTAASQLTIAPAQRVAGVLRMPGDKSISHRYVLLSALARGTTTIGGLSTGADVAATVACVRALGVPLETTGEGALVVRGRGRAALREPGGALDAANSGTTLRLLAGILAACPFAATVIGDASLSRRPMRRVIDPLTAMGASIVSDAGRPPLTISGGPLHAIDWQSPVASAQVKSAILLAGLAAQGVTSITEPLATRDHTERAFPLFGLEVVTAGLTSSVRGGQEAQAPDEPVRVPGDPSAAAVFAAAAAALPGSTVEIDGVGLNPRRTAFLEVLERMGALVRVERSTDQTSEPSGRVTVAHGGHGHAVITAAEVPDVIDELPVLAARAALGGSLEVSGASELRVKESDRISALVSGLQALGVDAEERPDGFMIRGRGRPTGGRVHAHDDHRLVMAFALVALGASAPTLIEGADAVAVSYPAFARDLAAICQ